MEKINTAILSIEEKTKTLIDEVRKAVPGATEHDVEKLTPAGQQMVLQARHCARKLFAESGDASWLNVGKQLAARWSKKVKVPTFESK